MPTVDHLVLFGEHFDIGGVERYVLQLAADATDAPRVTVLGTASDRFRQAAEAISRVDFVEVHPLRAYERVFPIRLARLLRRLRPTILHTQDVNARFRGHLAARAVGVPTVHTVHMSPVYYPGLPPLKRNVYRWAERAYSGLTDAFVFVSDVERELYEASRIVSPQRATTVHNGIAPVPERPVDRAATRERFGIGPDVPLATFVGRLAEQKGLDYLIEAAAQLGDTALQILIVGAGGDEGPLRELAAARCPDRVVFGGYQTPDAVHEILRASDLFVLPSRFEFFPFATLEALQAGLPCVVTDVGGNRDAVTSGENGLVVPAGRPDLLAEALRSLASDPDRRAAMSTVARETARTFSVDRMVHETEQVYARVVAPRA